MCRVIARIGCNLALLILTILAAAAQDCTDKIAIFRDMVDFYATPGGAQQRQEILASIENQRAVAVADSDASRYVSLLGSRLADALPAPRLVQYRFILYDDNLNLDVPWYGTLTRDAVIKSQIHVLPGSVVLVPLSLIDVSATESEFAAAIARGIAHVELKHFTRFINQAHQVLMPIPPAGRRPPVAPFSKTRLFPRSLEREADCSAAGVLALANFNPEALVRHVINGQGSFDTSDSRVEAIEVIVVKLPSRTYAPENSAQFEMLKARLKRLRALPALERIL